MQYFDLSDEYIELNKLLKLVGFCGTGGEAGLAISAGSVRVNGIVETRKRNKIRRGMFIQYGEFELTVR